VAEVRTTSSTGGQKGVKLQRFDLIPTGPLTELAEHYGVGASKYANHQWRNGYEWSKSYAALLRHLTEFWAGKDFDVCSNDPGGCSHVDADGNPFVAVREDACFNHTGSHHMAAVAWHAFCLLEFKDSFPEHDDRYKPPALDEDDLAEPRYIHIPEQQGFSLVDWVEQMAVQIFTVEDHETFARFSASSETGETEDHRPVDLINAAFQTRD